jgi:hypothetical protein
MAGAAWRGLSFSIRKYHGVAAAGWRVNVIAKLYIAKTQHSLSENWRPARLPFSACYG